MNTQLLDAPLRFAETTFTGDDLADEQVKDDLEQLMWDYSLDPQFTLYDELHYPDYRRVGSKHYDLCIYAALQALSEYIDSGWRCEFDADDAGYLEDAAWNIRSTYRSINPLIVSLASLIEQDARDYRQKYYSENGAA